MGRPLIKKKVEELETLLSSGQDDEALLETLQEELRCRRSRRAQALALEVQQALDRYRSGETRPALPMQRSATEMRKQPQVDPQPPPAPRRQGPSSDRPEDILSAWIALEVLSPQIYRKPADLGDGTSESVAWLNEMDHLPWEGDGELPRKGNRLYYHVVLGSIRMEPAFALLLSTFSDARPEQPQVHGSSPIAIVTIDREGRVVDDRSPAISSFAWALPIARPGQLGELAAWESLEERLNGQLVEVLARHRGDDASPLTYRAIHRAFAWLVTQLRLTEELVEPPSFAVRKHRWKPLHDSPEMPLLNSFFLGDLIRARRQVQTDRVPEALQRYLAMRDPESRVDLLADPDEIRAALWPTRASLGRWPGPGRHPLILMQQAAINLARIELADRGLFAINGPPGAGKTTLLRDLVASQVVERARAMARIEDPATAFTHRDRMTTGRGYIDMYEVAPQIRGFEVLVASTNNRAVENVAKELPGIGALAADLPPPRYLRVTSDAAAGREGSTWGLIAAVLGNAANRRQFRQAFWKNEDTSLKSYLLAVQGRHPMITEPATESEPERQRLPRVVEREAPPEGREQALTEWRSARRRLAAACEVVQEQLRLLERGRMAIEEQVSLERAIRETKGRWTELAETRDRICEEQQQREGELQVAEHGLEGAEHREQAHRRNRPFILLRLLRTRTWRAWSATWQDHQARVRAAQLQLADARHQLDSVVERRLDLDGSMHRLHEQRLELEARLAVAIETVQKARELAGPELGDAAFWERRATELHMSTPWLGPRVQAARDDVLVAAIEVHRAFLGVAAGPIRHNLAALMQIFLGRDLGEERQDLVGDLWATLFQVTPVISTTFASVERMLGELPPETLGWLLVDEAGQAVPQAAVGAILRSRRVVVVGDPQQIEPIVTLPEQLAQAICTERGVDVERWGAPIASVQTLADHASRYGSERQLGEGYAWVGAPLLVHRRCEQPMFSISNEVAYSRQMIFATPERPSRIRDVLGQSGWIDVHGSGESKWCPEEGNRVKALLQRLAESGLAEPDVFIISPFRVVVAGVMRLLRDDKTLLARLTEHPNQWPYERLGTVHTFQGKEAEAVILVLGAPEASQRGARSWAGGRPNLVNVAVSRAKQALYVVGNRQLWMGHGAFRALDRWLPGHPFSEDPE